MNQGKWAQLGATALLLLFALSLCQPELGEAIATINIWKHRYPFYGGYGGYYPFWGGYGAGYGGIGIGGFGYGRR